MRNGFLSGAAVIIAFSGAAYAETPSVAVDILPLHSLVAQVMDGVAAPNLIVQPGASPHGYALRPSEATALQRADIVFWIGEGLTPWLEGPLDALAGQAKSVQMVEIDGTNRLPYREGATFEHHDHDDHDHAHDHGHDDHDAFDSHAWLDPENARLWLGVIADELSGLDAANAETYRANAAAGQQRIAAVEAEAEATLAPVRDRGFVVFHDAYQYFEERFDIHAAGAISLGDASAPSPARIAEIQKTVTDLNVACVFSEPQFNPGLISAVLQGVDARTGVLDPNGSDLTPGPGLYPELIRTLAANLADCLSG